MSPIDVWRVAVDDMDFSFLVIDAVNTNCVETPGIA
jgi:hypothetical protein